MFDGKGFFGGGGEAHALCIGFACQRNAGLLGGMANLSGLSWVLASCRRERAKQQRCRIVGSLQCLPYSCSCHIVILVVCHMSSAALAAVVMGVGAAEHMRTGLCPMRPGSRLFAGGLGVLLNTYQSTIMRESALPQHSCTTALPWLCVAFMGWCVTQARRVCAGCMAAPHHSSSRCCGCQC